MAKFHELKYHEDEFPEKRKLTEEDIKFLINLQKEMNTQDHIGEADPRFWMIRETERIYNVDDDADGFEIYNESSCNSYSEDEFYDYLGDTILPELYPEEDGYTYTMFQNEDNDIELTIYLNGEPEESLDSTPDIIEHLNDNGYEFKICWYREISVLNGNGFFLTHKDAQEHLKHKAHHYSDDAHTYALTAFSPEIEKLYDILHKVDFESLLNKEDNEEKPDDNACRMNHTPEDILFAENYYNLYNMATKENKELEKKLKALTDEIYPTQLDVLDVPAYMPGSDSADEIREYMRQSHRFSDETIARADESFCYGFGCARDLIFSMLKKKFWDAKKKHPVIAQPCEEAQPCEDKIRYVSKSELNNLCKDFKKYVDKLGIPSDELAMLHNYIDDVYDLYSQAEDIPHIQTREIQMTNKEMANKEAIEELKCLRENMLLSLGRAEALDKAIQALEAQPTDAVSRQAVLDVINFEDEWLFDAKSHNADTKIAFSTIKSKISKMPPVTPQFTDEEIDRAQAVEQAYVDKMVELAVEESKRPKGKWIETLEHRDEFGSTWHYECSECRAKSYKGFEPLEKYCPNCGAEMNGGGEDDIND